MDSRTIIIKWLLDPNGNLLTIGTITSPTKKAINDPIDGKAEAIHTHSYNDLTDVKIHNKDKMFITFDSVIFHWYCMWWIRKHHSNIQNNFV